MAELPLTGLTVVDFTRLLPGPYATLVMADLGAQVTKVEAPQGGDYARWYPPLRGRTSYMFSALNSGKRSVAVDLKQPEGVAIALRLCQGADVVLESFRPGVMERLGLGYAALSEANPGLIYCAISGYGQDGPYRERAGHDLNYVGLGGLLGLAGPADGVPAMPAAQLADLGGGALWSLVSILSAVHARTTTGRGAFIDTAMADGSLGFLQMTLAPYLGGGAAPPARGADMLSGAQACYGIYETADGGFLTVAPLEPKFWKALCAAIERPDLLGRHVGRPEQVAATRAELAAIFAGRTRAQWEAIFAAVDACVEPVLRPDELAEHPLHVARGNVIEDESGLRRLRTPGRPRDAAAPGAAPELGQHTREVLAELGYDADAIDALARARVIAG
jgi:crotonobetainyl-CoA:carnitine CoA-transferase CaiB-like acyl-CoA transferase